MRHTPHHHTRSRGQRTIIAAQPTSRASINPPLSTGLDRAQCRRTASRPYTRCPKDLSFRIGLVIQTNTYQSSISTYITASSSVAVARESLEDPLCITAHRHSTPRLSPQLSISKEGDTTLHHNFPHAAPPRSSSLDFVRRAPLERRALIKTPTLPELATTLHDNQLPLPAVTLGLSLETLARAFWNTRFVLPGGGRKRGGRLGHCPPGP